MGKLRLLPLDDAVYLCRAKPAETSDYEKGVRRYQNILQLDYAIYRKLVARWCTPEYPTLLPGRTPGEAPLAADDENEEGDEDDEDDEAVGDTSEHMRKKSKAS